MFNEGQKEIVVTKHNSFQKVNIICQRRKSKSQFNDQNSYKLYIRNIEKNIGFLGYGNSKIFHSTIKIDQQDNVKSGAVNIIDEMKNMKKKSCAY